MEGEVGEDPKSALDDEETRDECKHQKTDDNRATLWEKGGRRFERSLTRVDEGGEMGWVGLGWRKKRRKEEES